MMKDFKGREVERAITFEDFIKNKILVHSVPTTGIAEDGLFTGEPSGITYVFATAEDYYRFAYWYWECYSPNVIKKANRSLEDMNDFRNLGLSIGLDLDKSLGEVLGENLLSTLAQEWFSLINIDLNNTTKEDGEEK